MKRFQLVWDYLAYCFSCHQHSRYMLVNKNVLKRINVKTCPKVFFSNKKIYIYFNCQWTLLMLVLNPFWQRQDKGWTERRHQNAVKSQPCSRNTQTLAPLVTLHKMSKKLPKMTVDSWRRFSHRRVFQQLSNYSHAHLTPKMIYLTFEKFWIKKQTKPTERICER